MQYEINIKKKAERNGVGKIAEAGTMEYQDFGVPVYAFSALTRSRIEWLQSALCETDKLKPAHDTCYEVLQLNAAYIGLDCCNHPVFPPEILETTARPLKDCTFPTEITLKFLKRLTTNRVRNDQVPENVSRDDVEEASSTVARGIVQNRESLFKQENFEAAKNGTLNLVNTRALKFVNPPMEPPVVHLKSMYKHQLPLLLHLIPHPDPHVVDPFDPSLLTNTFTFGRGLDKQPLQTSRMTGLSEVRSLERIEESSMKICSLIEGIADSGFAGVKDYADSDDEEIEKHGYWRNPYKTVWNGDVTYEVVKEDGNKMKVEIPLVARFYAGLVLSYANMSPSCALRCFEKLRQCLLPFCIPIPLVVYNSVFDTLHKQNRPVAAAVTLVESHLTHRNTPGWLLQKLFVGIIPNGSILAMNHALDLLEYIQEEPPEPNWHAIHNPDGMTGSLFLDEGTLDAALVMLSNHGEIHYVEKTIRLLERHNELVESGERLGTTVKLLPSAWNSVLYCMLAKMYTDDDISILIGWVKKMIENDVEIDFNVLDSGSRMQKTVWQLDALWNAMIAEVSEIASPKLVAAISHVVLNACAVRGDVDRTYMALDEMRLLDVPMDSFVHGCIVKAIYNSSNPSASAVETVMSDMFEKDLVVDERTRHYVLCTYCRDASPLGVYSFKAYEMVKELVNEGEFIREGTFTEIIRGLARKKYFREARELITIMEEKYGEAPKYLITRVEALEAHGGEDDEVQWGERIYHEEPKPERNDGVQGSNW